MGKTGELKQLWDVAAVTNVRINLVRSLLKCMQARHCPDLQSTWCLLCLSYDGGPGAAQVTFVFCAVLLVILSITYVLTRAKPVYLLNYAVYRPPDRWVCASPMQQGCMQNVPFRLAEPDD